ncbi:MAG: 5'-nucleotidase C-terminal domain-containing protein [Pseudomonadota bacterium]
MRVRHRFSEDAGPSEAHLRLIAFSDLHMRLMPYDYIAERPRSGESLALAAAEAETARQEADNALSFDIGDAFEGGPIDPQLYARAATEGHPMAQALAAAGVDAATLGNHDFNHGLAEIEQAIAGAAPPFVLANLVRACGPTPLEDTPLLPPVALLERDLLCGDGTRRTITVGVIGVAPPQTVDWDSARLGEALVARDIVPTVAAWAPELRRRGADLIVVLCHSGIGAATPSPGMEHAAVPVAAIPEVDVVLAGHAHGHFPDPGFPVAADAQGLVDPARGRLHGKPAVMPGFWGNRIGVVDLRLAAEPGGGWRIGAHEAALRAVAASAPHAGVAEAGARYHSDVVHTIGRIVAQSPLHLHTYFAQVADAPAVQVINAAQSAHVAALLAGRPEAALPLLSAAAPLKAGGRQAPEHFTDVPAGPLTLRHLVDLHVYQNSVVALRLSGAELRAWIERSASAFRQVPTGARDAQLLDPDHPSYGFDVVSGVTYRIDLTQAPLFDATGRRLEGRGRIVDLRHGGRPVRDDDAFVLATNSYRLGHGGGYPLPEAEPISLGPPASVRDILGAYLADHGADLAETPPVWGFLPQPGTTAVFETGSGARSAALPGRDAAGGSPLSPMGPGAAGTQLYRLDLSRAAVLGPP